ncbi:15144_t:CDS:2, partial [Gigaspora rosea]
WAMRMMNYQKKIEQYDGDKMENVIPLECLEIWDTRHVLVTHDEVYFYANDDNLFVWVEDKESIIKKKGQESAIMASDFLSDGYWKSENMVQQLRVFCFDQSTNNNVYALDALVCSRMTLYPKVENKFKFKNCWYIRDYEKITQPMFFLDENDSTILKERNMWTSQRLDCKRKENDEKGI